MIFKMALCLSALLVSSMMFPLAAAQQSRFVALANQSTYVPGDILVTYGKAYPNDAIIARLYDPAGRTIIFDTASTDGSGAFSKQLMTWTEPSRNFPFGRYTLEVSSSKIPSDKASITVSFAGDKEQASQQPLLHLLAAKLDSPTQVATKSTFRIFIQVTLDGALVNTNDPAELLNSSHIHFGNSTINLANRLRTLHEGIYYADVALEQEGVYIIHAIAYHRGFLAHDSKVISASASSIGTIQDSVDILSQKLDATRQELDRTNQVLEETRTGLGEDVKTASSAVDQLQQASGQINSIIIPILALIAIVIALQISLFARIRASYK